MKKVIIASVLKPVNDTRAFHKLALSLRETNKYHVNIIGFFAKNTPNEPNIVFTTLQHNHRLHYTRLTASLRFINFVKSYKPDLVVVTTYELLPAAVYLKKRMGFKLIYDVQENYSLNIKSNKTLPSWLGRILGGSVGYLEEKAFSSIDHFVLAERSYKLELGLRDNYTILENKTTIQPVKVSPFKLTSGQALTFVIYGTLTPVYGVEEAIDWFLNLSQHEPLFRLTIVGHVPLKSFHQTILEKVEGNVNIHHNLSSTPISYPQILTTASMADVVLLPYQQIASIRYKIPTKLYESLALGKPIIHSPNALWKDISAPYTASLELDFLNPPSSLDFLRQLHAHTFYQNSPGESISWTPESTRWTTLVDNLLG
ncbi:glycosyltransferase [Litoribacter populi]|uniref:glycosyltransferase n=1 Tax=Litoribacter populi TaxID=2598460 RepID=UPI001180FD9A|nr:glycosyltransferase [Litoribacter populi]